MNISKLIPCKIIIKTLYWTRKENEMIADLNRVCEKIDKGEMGNTSRKSSILVCKRAVFRINQT